MKAAIQQSYMDLQGSVDGDKVQMLEFVARTRKTMIKLLVLLKLQDLTDTLEKEQQVHQMIHQLDHSFEKASNDLYMIHQELRIAKIPNYDIPTAIDVLGTGSYRRLPRILKEFSKKEQSLDKRKFESQLKLLLYKEPMPHLMRKHLVIEDGQIKFQIVKMCSISLVLIPGEHIYKIVDLQIQTNSAQGYDIYDKKIHSMQIANLRDSIQQKLDMKPDYPLFKLYELLSLFLSKLALTTLSSQAKSLRDTRWQNNLWMTAEEDRLELMMWRKDLKTQDCIHMIIERPNVQLETFDATPALKSEAVIASKWEFGLQFRAFERSNQKDDMIEIEDPIDYGLLDMESVILRIADKRSKTTLLKLEQELIPLFDNRIESKMDQELPTLYIDFYQHNQIKFSVHPRKGNVVAQFQEIEKQEIVQQMIQQHKIKEAILLLRSLTILNQLLLVAQYLGLQHLNDEQHETLYFIVNDTTSMLGICVLDQVDNLDQGLYSVFLRTKDMEKHLIHYSDIFGEKKDWTNMDVQMLSKIIQYCKRIAWGTVIVNELENREVGYEFLIKRNSYTGKEMDQVRLLGLSPSLVVPAAYFDMLSTRTPMSGGPVGSVFISLLESGSLDENFTIRVQFRVHHDIYLHIPESTYLGRASFRKQNQLLVIDYSSPTFFLQSFLSDCSSAITILNMATRLMNSDQKQFKIGLESPFQLTIAYPEAQMRIGYEFPSMGQGAQPGQFVMLQYVIACSVRLTRTKHVDIKFMGLNHLHLAFPPNHAVSIVFQGTAGFLIADAAVLYGDTLKPFGVLQPQKLSPCPQFTGPFTQPTRPYKPGLLMTLLEYAMKIPNAQMTHFVHGEYCSMDVLPIAVDVLENYLDTMSLFYKLQDYCKSYPEFTELKVSVEERTLQVTCDCLKLEILGKENQTFIISLLNDGQQCAGLAMLFSQEVLKRKRGTFQYFVKLLQLMQCGKGIINNFEHCAQLVMSSSPPQKVKWEFFSDVDEFVVDVERKHIQFTFIQQQSVSVKLYYNVVTGIICLEGGKNLTFEEDPDKIEDIHAHMMELIKSTATKLEKVVYTASVRPVQAQTHAGPEKLFIILKHIKTWPISDLQ
ncbi:mediator complex subunit MED14-domain-containing protein [Gorgonomyces haynaldii]|nr:mediator complex subunit MED14-domain-containing protein [Gorgonomyces haynaldii]